jgi:hypothetical protein
MLDITQLRDTEELDLTRRRELAVGPQRVYALRVVLVAFAGVCRVQGGSGCLVLQGAVLWVMRRRVRAAHVRLGGVWWSRTIRDPLGSTVSTLRGARRQCCRRHIDSHSAPQWFEAVLFGGGMGECVKAVQMQLEM